MDKKEYMKVSEAAVKWGISTRRVRLLCSEGRIAGAWRKGGYFLSLQMPLVLQTGEYKS